MSRDHAYKVDPIGLVWCCATSLLPINSKIAALPKWHAGDHLYKMNYMDFVAQHRRANADITIGCLPCTEAQAQSFGVMKVQSGGVITEFAEKPKGQRLQEMKARRPCASRFHCLMCLLWPLSYLSGPRACCCRQRTHITLQWDWWLPVKGLNCVFGYGVRAHQCLLHRNVSL